MKSLLYAVNLIILVLFLNTGTINAQKAETLNPVLDREKISTPETPTVQPQSNNTLDFSRPVITGRVAEEQFLPPALYGTWQVTQTLINTNAPYLFRKRTSDIWVLQQAGKKIRLHNPNTRAQSIITVNMVQNNTATFTCSVRSGRQEDSEQPTITVDGNKFYGKNIYTIRLYDGQRVVSVSRAFFQIEAQKLSGPTPRIFIRQNRSE